MKRKISKTSYLPPQEKNSFSGVQELFTTIDEARERLSEITYFFRNNIIGITENDLDSFTEKNGENTLRSRIQEIESSLTTLKSTIDTSLSSLQDIDESAFLDASADILLQLKYLSSTFRLHFLKITNARLGDYDVGNAKKEVAPTSTQHKTKLVQTQKKLLPEGELTFHHVDKRSHFGLSLASLLIPLERVLHSLFHMTTDDMTLEEAFLHAQPLKTERHPDSFRKKQLNAKIVQTNHETSIQKLRHADLAFVYNLIHFPERIQKLKEIYEQKEGYETNVNYILLQQLCQETDEHRHTSTSPSHQKEMPITQDLQHQLIYTHIHAYIDSIQGYFRTSMLLNAQDVKEQVVLSLHSVQNALYQYLRIQEYAQKIIEGKKLKESQETTTAYAYMRKYEAVESLYKRKSRKHILEQLIAYNSSTKANEKLLIQRLQEILPQVLTLLPESYSMELHTIVGGKEKFTFEKDEARILDLLHEKLQFWSDTTDSSDFSQVFRDILEQPLLILFTALDTASEEGYFNTPAIKIKKKQYAQPQKYTPKNRIRSKNTMSRRRR